MICKAGVEIDLYSQDIANKAIDRRAVFEGECLAENNDCGDLSLEAGRFEIDLVHGLISSSPSGDRDTQGRSRPTGSFVRSSFSTQGGVGLTMRPLIKRLAVIQEGFMHELD